MYSLFEQLLECLKQQKDLATVMLEVSRKHLEALKNCRHEEIKLVVNRQQVLIWDADKLQKLCSARRVVLIKELALSEDTVLSNLVSLAPETLRIELQGIIKDLKALVLKLQDVNETNKLLTNNALELNDLLKKIFLPTQGRTYQGDGAVSNKQPAISRLNLMV